jgi:hypothetical protein
MPIGVDRLPQENWVLGLDVEAFFPVGLDIPQDTLRAAANDEATLPVFRSMFIESIRLGELVSGNVVLPIVIAQTRALRSLVGSATGSTRASLLLLATLNASYAGWLTLEAGHDRAAKGWSDLAVGMASRTGDVDLIAYTFIRQAQIALYHDDAALTIALAKRAQRDPRVAPRFRGVAASREAQGHALAGDYDQCRQALDRSIELLVGADGSSTLDGVPLPPMFGGGSTGYAIGYIVGWCLHDLGRSRKAGEVLDQDIVLIPEGHRRAALRYAARRVLAHATAGEVDHACVLAHELLDTSELVDSAMTRLELRRIMQTLRRWPDHGSVRELRPRLVATLRSSVT